MITLSKAGKIRSFVQKGIWVEVGISQDPLCRRIRNRNRVGQELNSVIKVILIEKLRSVNFWRKSCVTRKTSNAMTLR